MKALVLPTFSLLLLCLRASDGCTVHCPENSNNEETYFTNPNDCSKYYHCVHSEPVMRSCPEGLWFNNPENKCDYPENVNCDAICCEESFIKYPSADCILYDDEECDKEGQNEGVKVMTKGSEILDVESELDFDIESVSIRAGCQLFIATGTEFRGNKHEFTAGEDDMHITFDEYPELEDFDDNVNSARCSCD